MRFFVGTSGYSYKEWKGSFYPEKLPQADMLRYYAERFAAVEINSSFYRMPSASDLESWAGQVHAGFRFAFKAPQTITHRKRLKNAEEATEFFLQATATLGPRRGPLLFQLHPSVKKDLPRLEAFVTLLGKRVQAAFEFRHESWLDEDVYGCLRAGRCALCIADAEDLPAAELVNTAGWGYIRLRRDEYTGASLAQWVKKIKAQGWDEAYIFFKHEDTGSGPKLAARFLELAGP